MKKLLVTGGAGFIGSNFILYMLDRQEDVEIVNVDKLTYAGNLENLRAVESHPRYVFVQDDIRDREAMETLFQRHDFDWVVNFAAETHVDRSIKDPDIFVSTNVTGTVNLLNLARAQWETGEDMYRPGVKFLQVSTDEVYGSLGPEGFFTEETPLNPRSPYSASKASADLLVKAYAETYRMPVNITRCSNNYGPFQFPEKWIPLIIHNALNLKPLPVYGDGLQIRDWLYVDDHCSAIDRVLRKGRPGEVYNVGGHNERTNIQIVKTILAFLHDRVNPAIDEGLIQHVKDRKGHDRRYAIDPEKIGRELGWKPETPFEKGVEKTIEWYLENPGWLADVTSGAYQQYYQTMYQHETEGE